MSPPPNRNFFKRIAVRQPSEVRDHHPSATCGVKPPRLPHAFARAAINRRATVTAFAKLVTRATPLPAMPNAVP